MKNNAFLLSAFLSAFNAGMASIAEKLAPLYIGATVFCGLLAIAFAIREESK